MRTGAKVRYNGGEKQTGRDGAINTEHAPNHPAAGDSVEMAEADPTTGKSPAFQFYPKDFLSDRNVVVMSMQERGVYITMICHAWQDPLPVDHAQLARICGVPLSSFRKMWPALSVCFREVDGVLIHPRLERERQKQAEYRAEKSDAGKRGAAKRWQKDGSAIEVPIAKDGKATDLPMAENASSSAFASASSFAVFRQRVPSPEAPADVSRRAGEFVSYYEETHQRIFGLGYLGNPQKDDAASLNLCERFTDDELRDAVVVWFGMQDDFATRGNRTIPKFASRVTECIEKARRVSA